VRPNYRDELDSLRLLDTALIKLYGMTLNWAQMSAFLKVCFMRICLFDAAAASWPSALSIGRY
jgi:hypothetical protein